ncbi:winged helix-turn-helix domain-containing protein [Paraglaciecola sp.]|uniref:winged helix-turn-helix domain-containing protein n=1 Tax=Paraglaciecola sp. TaxID=1920173 RepID=UPI003EF79AD9
MLALSKSLQRATPATFILVRGYMQEQYWISGFFIDLSRNQITQNKQSQTLAPKALAVLTYLAENQGKVVSHDALLAKVWQDTIVSPNTLQRSIAQLRKALGDDEKIYIKTHAKQGYSLECDVRWGEQTKHKALPEKTALVEDNNAVEPSKINIIEQESVSEKPARSVLSIFSIVLGFLLLVVIGYRSITVEKPAKLTIGEIRLLTTTDNKELASVYSPDGKYVVFHRYSEQFCANNIWAKNTKTQEEFQLTKDLDSHGSHSFSKDGKKLVFIKSAGCSKPTTQKQCYELMSLDFMSALESPQSPRVLVECKNSKIKTPIWLNNNNIALLQKYTDRWKLITYSISDNQSGVIYALDDGNIIDYDYSPVDDLIALTSIHADGHYYIEVLKTDGQLVSRHRINYPEEVAKFRLVYPNFSPLENHLVFSTGRQLFTMSFDGKVTNVSLPLDSAISTPIFHPNGDRMIVISGHYDSDIAALTLSEISDNQSIGKISKEQSSVLERSILAEDNAIFQPNGELIAFESRRSGESQIWVTSGKGAKQLSDFPMDTYIYGFDWSADGNSILVNANNVLTQVNLDSSQHSFDLVYPVVDLFQWDSHNNIALALVRIKGIVKFAEVNLVDSDVRIINDKLVNWALKSNKDELIYVDHMDRFWRQGSAEDEVIEALNGRGKNKQKFLINGEVIYGVNGKLALWSYDLNSEEFKTLGNLPKNTDEITDVDETQLLISVRISARKEVAELSLIP